MKPKLSKEAIKVLNTSPQKKAALLKQSLIKVANQQNKKR